MRSLSQVELLIAAGGATVNFYYGAADTTITLAAGSVSGVLEWLEGQ